MSSYVLKQQIAWGNHIKEMIHKLIVTHKINAQRNHLEYINIDQSIISHLKAFENEVTLGDKGNREGLSAKMYFRSLFGKDFKRFNDDVINAGLNYGYSILRSLISRALVAKGLNTSIGFFHKGPNNPFNLSDDVIEPFRPLIDAHVFENLREEKIFKKKLKKN